MPKFSDEEMELIKIVGEEVFSYLLKAYRESKKRKIDLFELLEKASKYNDMDIDEIGV